ncbi:MAG: hypothetical protein Q8R34_01715 [bacterium]|nr:hypothetical protein [bacterium]
MKPNAKFLKVLVEQNCWELVGKRFAWVATSPSKKEGTVVVRPGQDFARQKEKKMFLKDKKEGKLEIKIFSLPEQLAINEVLHLINTGAVEFINMIFFSGITATPFRRISATSMEQFTFPQSPFPLLFVQTTMERDFEEK